MSDNTSGVDYGATYIYRLAYLSLALTLDDRRISPVSVDHLADDRRTESVPLSAFVWLTLTVCLALVGRNTRTVVSHRTVFLRDPVEPGHRGASTARGIGAPGSSDGTYFTVARQGLGTAANQPRGHVMSSHYITSADHLPEESGAETTLQITDAQTKRIFEARVRIAQDPDELADPVPLTVVAGPHESVSETMYVELLDETDASGLDRELLTRLATDQEAASNVLNTRSDDLSVLLRYLVETGEYESTADALREVAFDGLAAERSALLDAYAEVREELHDDPLGRAIAERE